MSKSRRRSPLSRLQKFVFEATGLPLNLVLKIVAISIIAIVGIAWTVLYTNADQDSKGSSIAATDSTRMTSEEKFKIVSVMPPDFSKRHAVERIDLVTSKIEVGEELSRSGGHFSERATDQLVLLYGCLLYTSPSPRDKRQSRMPSSA